MRVFAHPNGSGKTIIIDRLKNQINFGVYVNADDIEVILGTKRALNFGDYQIKVDDITLKEFFRKSDFAPIKRNEPDLWQKLAVKNTHRAFIFDNSGTVAYLIAEITDGKSVNLIDNNKVPN